LSREPLGPLFGHLSLATLLLPLLNEFDVGGELPSVRAEKLQVARRGVDASPLDVQDEQDRRWLEACVWPDQLHRLERLRAAVRALPPEQRAAIALFYFEGMTVAETAVALDVPAGTVKTRLMHARRKLRNALEGGERCEISTE
jgi:DNA-directed RNA polymerase specialized sigma24 family protein